MYGGCLTGASDEPTHRPAAVAFKLDRDSGDIELAWRGTFRAVLCDGSRVVVCASHQPAADRSESSSSTSAEPAGRCSLHLDSGVLVIACGFDWPSALDGDVAAVVAAQTEQLDAWEHSAAAAAVLGALKRNKTFGLAGSTAAACTLVLIDGRPESERPVIGLLRCLTHQQDDAQIAADAQISSALAQASQLMRLNPLAAQYVASRGIAQVVMDWLCRGDSVPAVAESAGTLLSSLVEPGFLAVKAVGEHLFGKFGSMAELLARLSSPTPAVASWAAVAVAALAERSIAAFCIVQCAGRVGDVLERIDAGALPARVQSLAASLRGMVREAAIQAPSVPAAAVLGCANRILERLGKRFWGATDEPMQVEDQLVLEYAATKPDAAVQAAAAAPSIVSSLIDFSRGLEKLQLMQQHAKQALWHLVAAGDAAACAVVASKGAGTELLATQTDQASTAQTLMSLLRLGGAPALLAAELLYTAAARIDVLKAAAVAAGAVPLLVSLVLAATQPGASQPQQELAAEAAKALSSVMAGNAAWRLTVAKSMDVAGWLPLLEVDSVDAMRPAAEALAAAAASGHAPELAAAEGGRALRLLVQLLQGSSLNSVLIPTASALAAVAVAGQAERGALVAAGCVPALAALLSRMDVLKPAMRALAAIAVPAEADSAAQKALAQLAAAGAQRDIEALKGHASSEIAGQAEAVAAALVAAPPGSPPMTSSTVPLAAVAETAAAAAPAAVLLAASSVAPSATGFVDSLEAAAKRKSLVSSSGKTPLCDSYARGYCQQGSACKFAHGEHELAGNSGTTPSPSALQSKATQPTVPYNYKTELCMFHRKGRCNRGAQCPFAHGAAELRRLPAQRTAPPAAPQPPSKPQQATSQAKQQAVVLAAAPAVPEVSSVDSLAAAAKQGDVSHLSLLQADDSARASGGAALQTALIAAAGAGKAAAVTQLLDAGADPNKPAGQTPLLAAAAAGRTEVISLLLASGADINQGSGPEGHTALMAVASGGHLSAIEALVKAGADVEAAAPGGLRALHLAAQKGHRYTCKDLLRSGANACARTVTGLTPLHYAAGSGAVTFEGFDLCKDLIEKGADASAAAADGVQPLHLAAACGSVDVCRLLLRCGADASAPDKRGWTPLHYGADSGSAGVCALLLEAGASAGVATAGGQTPLQLAEAKGHEVVAALLRKAAASEQAAPSDAASSSIQPSAAAAASAAPLPAAAAASAASVLSASAMPLAVAHSEATSEPLMSATGNLAAAAQPLWQAATQGSWEAVEALLDAGADVAAADNRGRSALHFAAAHGAADAVGLLLSLGADVAAADGRNWTPLHYAAESGSVAACSLLLRHGACALAGAPDDMTPVDVAEASGRTEAAELLRDAATAVSAPAGAAASQLAQLTSASSVSLLQPLTQLPVDPLLVCPLTGQVMSDPVMLVATGRTYERAAIEDWIAERGAVCPRSRSRLQTTMLVENAAVRERLEELRAAAAAAAAASSAQPPRLQPRAANLMALVSSRGGLPEAEARFFFVQLVIALRARHAIGHAPCSVTPAGITLRSLLGLELELLKV